MISLSIDTDFHGSFPDNKLTNIVIEDGWII